MSSFDAYLVQPFRYAKRQTIRVASRLSGRTLDAPLQRFNMWSDLLLMRGCADFRRWVMGPHVTAVLTSTPNGDLLIGADDYELGKALAVVGGYEGARVDELLKSLPTGARVLIIGAHVGTLLVPLAQKGHPIVAIEANPKTYALLRLNIALNGLSNVETHWCAAGDEERDVEFYASRVNSGGSKVKPKADSFEFVYDRPERYTVKMRRLDDLLPNEHFTTAIMDIEGAEYFALRGMEAILSHLRMLQIEYIPNHLRKVAGVSMEEFLALLSPHFARVRVVGETGRAYGREEFSTLLARITAEVGEFGGRDLVFEK